MPTEDELNEMAQKLFDETSEFVDLTPTEKAVVMKLAIGASISRTLDRMYENGIPAAQI